MGDGTMRSLPKKNKKQIADYDIDTKFAMQSLQRAMERYLEVAKSEHISHNDIVSTIHILNWARRTIDENIDDAQTKILIREYQLTNRPVL